VVLCVSPHSRVRKAQLIVVVGVMSGGPARESERATDTLARSPIVWEFPPSISRSNGAMSPSLLPCLKTEDHIDSVLSSFDLATSETLSVTSTTDTASVSADALALVDAKQNRKKSVRPRSHVHRIVRVHDQDVVFEKGDARVRRSSRVAGPSSVTPDGLEVYRETIAKMEHVLVRDEKRAHGDEATNASRRRGRGGSQGLLIAPTGKGPCLRAEKVEEQAETNHILHLKSRNVQEKQQSRDPSWISAGRSAPPTYGTLLEQSLASNAASSSVSKTQRRATQAAALQTTRISCASIGQATAAQIAAVAVVIALAEADLRGACDGPVVHSGADAHSADPCLALAWLDAARTNAVKGAEPELVAVVSAVDGAYNIHPARVGTETIYTAARRLARMELQTEEISTVVGSFAGKHMLVAICRSIDGDYEIDKMWASFVLIVYLASDPRGRSLLQTTGLTDLDIHVACTIEAYGRAEITRRSRLRSSRARQKREASAPRDFDAETNLLVEDEDNAADHWLCLAENESSDHASEDEDSESHRVLSTKRKRSAKGATSSAGSGNDAHEIISWWCCALRCKDRSVLQTLVASTRADAEEAAETTLQHQTDCDAVRRNETIRSLARDAAVQSACAIIGNLVSAQNAPRWIALSPNQNPSGRSAVALLRGEGDARNRVLHACRLAPLQLQPRRSAKRAVLWSVAAMEVFCRARRGENDANVYLPAVLTRHHRLARAKAAAAAATKRGGHRLADNDTVRAVERLEQSIRLETSRALPSAACGAARSVLVLRVSCPVGRLSLQSSRALADEARSLHARATSAADAALVDPSAPLGAVDSRPAHVQTSVPDRVEPLSAPCPRLGHLLHTNELLRRLMHPCAHAKTRRNDPCRLLLGHVEPRELSLNDVPIIDCEPFPIAPVVDFHLRASPGAPLSATEPSVARDHVPFDVALHVALHRAVGAVEAIRSRGDDFWHQRALLYAGSSQASFVGDTANAVGAGHTNAAVNTSRRISCADTTKRSFLSIYDVYCGGVPNVGVSLRGSAYEGAHGPLLDTGVTAPGLDSKFTTSDRRGHGCMTLSPKVADEVSKRLATSHFVRCGDGFYVEAPAATRGIPHGYIAGVHSLCADYLGAVEAVAAAAADGADPKEDDNEVVNALWVLPVSAFTQALRPDTTFLADVTLQRCVRDDAQLSSSTGRAYLSHATSEDEAVFREPHFRRACQSNVGDNPFSECGDYVDSVLNAIAGLSVAASLVGGCDALRMLIDAWHGDDDVDPPGGCWLWASDACVLLFGVVYPQNHAIALETVPDVYARAAAANARLARTGGEARAGARLARLGAADKQVEEARALWRRAVRADAPERSAWSVGVAPLIHAFEERQGRHDMTAAETDEFRKLFYQVCYRAAWFMYSEDGHAPPPRPNPAAQCATPEDVRRSSFDPVFAAVGNDFEHELPRGCLVGVKPFQLRQVYSLLMGAHLPDVVVQLVRNEGGLLLRESARATVVESDGRPRSSKAISYVQTEGDSAAYGSRKAKVYSGHLQSTAWDANVLLQAPLYAAIDPPRAPDARARGQIGSARGLREYAHRHEMDRMHVCTAEAWARRQFLDAVASEAHAKMCL
jgi:hypothetical protein